MLWSVSGSVLSSYTIHIKNCPQQGCVTDLFSLTSSKPSSLRLVMSPMHLTEVPGKSGTDILQGGLSSLLKPQLQDKIVQVPKTTDTDFTSCFNLCSVNIPPHPRKVGPFLPCSKTSQLCGYVQLRFLGPGCILFSRWAVNEQETTPKYLKQNQNIHSSLQGDRIETNTKDGWVETGNWEPTAYGQFSPFPCLPRSLSLYVDVPPAADTRWSLMSTSACIHKAISFYLHDRHSAF